MVTEDHLRTDPALRGSLAVLRRGLRESPELRRGLWLTVVVSLGVTVAELTTPLLVQQVFDRGLDPFRPGFVWTICAVAFLVVLVTFVGARIAGRRLVRASELALRNLRVRTFRHIHRLSIADQSEEKRGVFVARVTADVDALQEFMEWGGVAWIVSGTQAAGALVLMLVFSWQLTLAIVLLLIPMLAIVGSMQARLTQAFNVARTRVGQMLSEVSESVMGAAVVRAYGLEQHTHAKVRRAIDERYRAEVLAHLRAATLWPMATAFYAIALAVVVAVGSGLGPDWGLTLGRVTAFLFLATVFLGVFMDLPEIYAETQTAIAGWRKILAVLDLPLDVVEPAEGERLASGPLPIVARGVRFAYRDGPEVLLGISLDVPAGAHVAIVGATGCGKTTFAKLLARLADPTAGTIEIGGIDLRRIDPDARRSAIRMVPQDGFLFDATIGVNVRLGRPGATERDARAALEELGLGAWVDTLPQGLATPVGERGEALSAGERQLVALARAHIGDPGLLILDEATSAVDPATERQITEALRRASEGRTTVTIAHRLSTAEAADRVFVFDAGRLVESGTHAELVRAGGVYARLYDRWLGNTGSGGRPDGDGRP
ncbi:MAG: multidrug ABC transporter ATP-binding protein [Actinomycetota bacterium]|jgi:putative ABC transport system ATP-binding protein|nr:MAG: multidrug ABC transporter ATP-binding protein [Actinomycetota bacterium]